MSFLTWSVGGTLPDQQSGAETRAASSGSPPLGRLVRGEPWRTNTQHIRLVGGLWTDKDRPVRSRTATIILQDTIETINPR